LIDLARSSWQLKQLVAFVADKNLASARVLEKCGFAREQVQDSRADAIAVIKMKIEIRTWGGLATPPTTFAIP